MAAVTENGSQQVGWQLLAAKHPVMLQLHPMQLPCFQTLLCNLLLCVLWRPHPWM